MHQNNLANTVNMHLLKLREQRPHAYTLSNKNICTDAPHIEKIVKIKGTYRLQIVIH